MPQSALEIISRLAVMYPLMFQIVPAMDAQSGSRPLHCGVLEFLAPEGIVYLPSWMIRSLGFLPAESSMKRDLVTLKNLALPLGTFIKLQPQSVAFLDITDPRAVLEHALRQFTTLTQGDIFPIFYNEQVFEFEVKEVKPCRQSCAISVVETDLQVEFEAPVGYVEPTKSQPPKPETNETKKTDSLFSGTSYRLSDAQTPNSPSTTTGTPNSKIFKPSTSNPAVSAPLKLPRGSLSFAKSPASSSSTSSTPGSQKKLFEGNPNSLRQ